jgi:hypothetical protein
MKKLILSLALCCAATNFFAQNAKVKLHLNLKIIRLHLQNSAPI